MIHKEGPLYTNRRETYPLLEKEHVYPLGAANILCPMMYVFEEHVPISLLVVSGFVQH